ncbi:MAG: putative zinc-binding metallopeptidase [bacterium]
MCDLGLTLEGSGLEPRLREMEGELLARGLAFRPHFWLSDEWFCPDGVPGIAIPFYLGHPRLMRLEQSQMLEVEGGTRDWCLKILRHEAGHAIENAYRLRLRKTRRELFGRSSEPYPEYYLPKPYSKSYVIHLDAWYAQSHPDEDFAETFAVWLNPDSRWPERYAGWPALRKIEYVDEVMARLRGRPAPVDNKDEVEPVSRIEKTLRAHYEERRRVYGLDHPDFYDRDLNRLFGPGSAHPQRPRAAAFVGRIRREVRRRVAHWTGTYQYTIDQVLKDIIKRCGEMDLRLVRPEDETKLEFIILLTVQTMNYLSSGRHRMAL